MPRIPFPIFSSSIRAGHGGIRYAGDQEIRGILEAKVKMFGFDSMVRMRMEALVRSDGVVMLGFQGCGKVLAARCTRPLLSPWCDGWDGGCNVGSGGRDHGWRKGDLFTVVGMRRRMRMDEGCWVVVRMRIKVLLSWFSRAQSSVSAVWFIEIIYWIFILVMVFICISTYYF